MTTVVARRVDPTELDAAGRPLHGLQHRVRGAPPEAAELSERIGRLIEGGDTVVLVATGSGVGGPDGPVMYVYERDL